MFQSAVPLRSSCLLLIAATATAAAGGDDVTATGDGRAPGDAAGPTGHEDRTGHDPPAAPGDAGVDARAVARCEAGLAHAARGDRPRAWLYLEPCRDEDLAPELAGRVRRARREVARALEASALSALTIVTNPEGLVAETDALPGERFTTPATIWARAGRYRVVVARDSSAFDAGQGVASEAVLEEFSRSTVIVEVPRPPAAPRTGTVDFTEDPSAQAAHVGPPPKPRFGSMLPGKYLGARPPSGPPLNDPLADRRPGAGRWRLGVRAGAGVFTRAAEATGPALSLGLVASRSLSARAALAARLGYAHRDLDVFALDAGPRIELARLRSWRLVAAAALRAELRVQGSLAMQPVTPVGLGAAVGVELAVSSVPVTIGLRAEPGLTELVAGARDHTALLELGVDL